MEAPTPPGFLTDRGLRIFHEIYRLSLVQDTWHPGFRLSLNVMASVCDRYLDMAENDPGNADTEEMRALARKFMSDFMLIEEKYTAIGEVDEHGIDVQVKKLA